MRKFFEKPKELCKHGKSGVECEECKLEIDEARTEADIIKGLSLMDRSKIEMASYRSRPRPETALSARSRRDSIKERTHPAAIEKRVGGLESLAALPAERSEEYGRKTRAESDLKEALQIGRLASALESQIHDLQGELEELKRYPSMELSRLKELNEEELQKTGILWRPEDLGSVTKEVRARIEKHKEG